MFDLSQSAASSLNGWSNAALVIGAVLALGGTIVSIWTAGVLARYSDEQIAIANREAARANEQAAKLNKEAAALKVELQERTQPLVARAVTSEQAKQLKSILNGRMAEVRIFGPVGDQEILEYMKQLEEAFRSAGANVELHFPGIVMVGKTAFPMGITLHGERNSNFLLIENALRSAGISFIEKNPPSELPFAGTALIIGPRPQLNP